MTTRIGRVTNIYPDTGKVKVVYEDSKSSSLPLSMLTMNNEYSMPKVGERVVTMHMENGSSKGFVLGTYYGGGMKPKASIGYRKDFGGDAYVSCAGGSYQIFAPYILLNGKNIKLKADNMTFEAENIVLKCSYGEISVEELVKRLERIEDQLGLPHTV